MTNYFKPEKWQLSPKTDYTYAKSGAYSPRYINRHVDQPNMSRPPLRQRVGYYEDTDYGNDSDYTPYHRHDSTRSYSPRSRRPTAVQQAWYYTILTIITTIVTTTTTIITESCYTVGSTLGIVEPRTRSGASHTTKSDSLLVAYSKKVTSCIWQTLSYLTVWRLFGYTNSEQQVSTKKSVKKTKRYSTRTFQAQNNGELAVRRETWLSKFVWTIVHWYTVLMWYPFGATLREAVRRRLFSTASESGTEQSWFWLFIQRIVTCVTTVLWLPVGAVGAVWNAVRTVWGVKQKGSPTVGEEIAQDVVGPGGQTQTVTMTTVSEEGKSGRKKRKMVTTTVTKTMVTHTSDTRHQSDASMDDQQSFLWRWVRSAISSIAYILWFPLGLLSIAYHSVKSLRMSAETGESERSSTSRVYSTSQQSEQSEMRSQDETEVTAQTKRDSLLLRFYRKCRSCLVGAGSYILAPVSVVSTFGKSFRKTDSESDISGSSSRSQRMSYRSSRITRSEEQEQSSFLSQEKTQSPFINLLWMPIGLIVSCWRRVYEAVYWVGSLVLVGDTYCYTKWRQLMDKMGSIFCWRSTDIRVAESESDTTSSASKGLLSWIKRLLLLILALLWLPIGLLLLPWYGIQRVIKGIRSGSWWTRTKSCLSAAWLTIGAVFSDRKESESNTLSAASSTSQKGGILTFLKRILFLPLALLWIPIGLLLLIWGYTRRGVHSIWSWVKKVTILLWSCARRCASVAWMALGVLFWQDGDSLAAADSEQSAAVLLITRIKTIIITYLWLPIAADLWLLRRRRWWLALLLLLFLFALGDSIYRYKGRRRDVEVYPSTLIFPHSTDSVPYIHTVKASGGSGSYNWSSSNPLIATVVGGLVASAGHAGKAMIIATDAKNASFKATSQVYVMPVAGLSFATCTKEAEVGSRLLLPLIIYGSNEKDGQRMAFTDSSHLPINVQVSDPSVFSFVAVETHPHGEGTQQAVVLEARGEGNTEVTVTAGGPGSAVSTNLAIAALAVPKEEEKPSAQDAVIAALQAEILALQLRLGSGSRDDKAKLDSLQVESLRAEQSVALAELRAEIAALRIKLDGNIYGQSQQNSSEFLLLKTEHEAILAKLQAEIAALQAKIAPCCGKESETIIAFGAFKDSQSAAIEELEANILALQRQIDEKIDRKPEDSGFDLFKATTTAALAALTAQLGTMQSQLNEKLILASTDTDEESKLLLLQQSQEAALVGIREEIAALQNKLDGHIGIAVSDTKLQELRESNDATIAGLSATLLALQSKVDQVSAAPQKNEELEALRTAHEAALAALRADITDLKMKLDSKMDATEAEPKWTSFEKAQTVALAALEAQILALQNQVSSKADNDDVQAKLDELKSSQAVIIAGLKSDVSQVQDKLVIVAAAHESSQTDDGDKSAAIAGLRADLLSLQDKLDGRIVALEKGCEFHCGGAIIGDDTTGIAGLAALQAELAILTNKIKTLEGQGLFMDGEKVLAIVRKFWADKTGMADYALESGGGSVISARCTRTYARRTALISLFGIPLWYLSNSPRTVIQPDMHPGQCWAFAGQEGELVIRLACHVHISAVSVEHIPRELSPYNNISSALQDFTVQGLEDEREMEGSSLGNFKYLDNGEPLQMFNIDPSHPPFQFILFKISSNHGNEEYTCIYRIRVHGRCTDTLW